MTTCAVHDFHPVNNMPAAYRCAKCGGFAYKPKARRDSGWGTNDLTMYRCHKTGCERPVVVIYPEVRARRTHRPSCAVHRPEEHLRQPC